jgi:hypothetical protein
MKLLEEANGSLVSDFWRCQKRQREYFFWAAASGDVSDRCGRGVRNGQTEWERRKSGSLTYSSRIIFEKEDQLIFGG